MRGTEARYLFKFVRRSTTWNSEVKHVQSASMLKTYPDEPLLKNTNWYVSALRTFTTTCVHAGVISYGIVDQFLYVRLVGN